MHDPKTVAHEIKNPFVKKRHGYRPSLLTVWHCDPEKDGTDDSCGWFIRSRHIDQKMLEKVRKEFEFNFKNNYWFNEAGYPKFSTIGLVLEMYNVAVREIFQYQNKGKVDWKRHRKFMKKHLYDIICFAENSTDSLHNAIMMKYGVEKQEYRIEHFTSIITADIMRKERKWWQHPKWHIHHWQIQFHPFQNLKRRYWDKCAICGKRGFKGSAMGDWYGTKIWHQECDQSAKVPQTEP